MLHNPLLRQLGIFLSYGFDNGLVFRKCFVGFPDQPLGITAQYEITPFEEVDHIVVSELFDIELSFVALFDYAFPDKAVESFGNWSDADAEVGCQFFFLRTGTQFSGFVRYLRVSAGQERHNCR